VFPCTCSRRDLAAAPLSRLGERVYPGRCRTRVDEQAGATAWRVRTDERAIAFTDRLQGRQVQRLATDVGDFVVYRADGFFAYQLAVVVDDADQGITDVVRGADLLASTPRQIYLQGLLGLPTPAYLHVPAALNAAGEKLSKQTRAPALSRTEPLRELLAAWRFLDQPAPRTSLGSIERFWEHALSHWDPRRLPPVQMLPGALAATA
jgi:glutamyl-Q tRNA(Asp) synthetase